MTQSQLVLHLRYSAWFCAFASIPVNTSMHLACNHTRDKEGEGGKWGHWGAMSSISVC